MQKICSLRSINPYNPFLGMWITLTRQPRWTDQPLHPEQRISREQAIRLYTINNAYADMSRNGSPVAMAPSIAARFGCEQARQVLGALKPQQTPSES